MFCYTVYIIADDGLTNLNIRQPQYSWSHVIEWKLNRICSPAVLSLKMISPWHAQRQVKECCFHPTNLIQSITENSISTDINVIKFISFHFEMSLDSVFFSVLFILSIDTLINTFQLVANILFPIKYPNVFNIRCDAMLIMLMHTIFGIKFITMAWNLYALIYRHS